MISVRDATFMFRTCPLTACGAATVLGATKVEPACTAFTDVTVLTPTATVAAHSTVVACGERIEFAGAAVRAMFGSVCPPSKRDVTRS